MLSVNRGSFISSLSLSQSTRFYFSSWLIVQAKARNTFYKTMYLNFHLQDKIEWIHFSLFFLLSITKIYEHCTYKTKYGDAER